MKQKGVGMVACFVVLYKVFPSFGLIGLSDTDDIVLKPWLKNLDDSITDKV